MAKGRSYCVLKEKLIREENLKMQPTTEILARISRNSLANKDEIFTRLYRYMLRPDLYFLAYKNLYANSGAATKVQTMTRQMDSAKPKSQISSKGSLMKPTSPHPPEEPISRRRTIPRKSDLWESRHSQISWYRKFCGWFSKRCMSLFSCQFPMDSDPKGAAIPH